MKENLEYFEKLLDRLLFCMRELDYSYDIISNSKLISYIHLKKKDEYVCHVLIDYECTNYIQIGYSFSFPLDFSVFLSQNMSDIHYYLSKYGCFMEFETSPSSIDITFCNKVYYSGFNYDSFSDCIVGLLSLLKQINELFTKKLNISLNMYSIKEEEELAAFAKDLDFEDDEDIDDEDDEDFDE